MPGAGVPRRLFVDSGAWIALRSRRDQHHAEADRLFREALRCRIPLVTTDLVLAELHRLTLYRTGVLPALRALDRIDASPSVAIHFATAEDHAAARRWLERLAPRPVTYTDAVSFAVMDGLRCRHALAFDDDFTVAGFEIWRPMPRLIFDSYISRVLQVRVVTGQCAEFTTTPGPRRWTRLSAGAPPPPAPAG